LHMKLITYANVVSDCKTHGLNTANILHMASQLAEKGSGVAADPIQLAEGTPATKDKVPSRSCFSSGRSSAGSAPSSISEPDLEAFSMPRSVIEELEADATPSTKKKQRLRPKQEVLDKLVAKHLCTKNSDQNLSVKILRAYCKAWQSEPELHDVVFTAGMDQDLLRPISLLVAHHMWLSAIASHNSCSVASIRKRTAYVDGTVCKKSLAFDSDVDEEGEEVITTAAKKRRKDDRVRRKRKSPE